VLALSAANRIPSVIRSCTISSVSASSNCPSLSLLSFPPLSYK
jgi:hypothetical protein